MKKHTLPLQTVRIRNFKAIQDSGPIKLTPLTVFIGNNGSGKSSVLEAMEFLQAVALRGLEDAAGPWRGFEHIWNKAVTHAPRKGDAWAPNPMRFFVRGHSDKRTFNAHTEISEPLTDGSTYFKSEHVELLRLFYRERRGDEVATERPDKRTEQKEAKRDLAKIDPDQSLLGRDGHIPFESWAFLALDPAAMAQPMRRTRYGTSRGLSKTGQNLAEYLLSFYEADPNGFAALLETLRLVLPYARELQPRVVSDVIEKRIFLQLREQAKKVVFDVVSWVLSTGTLRILALLACLRHPTLAPAVLFVDEIENGLDPRTIGLLVSEIRDAVEAGLTQVIATTHSPYLLDQLSLSQLVLVERDKTGAPRFTRPAEDAALRKWAKDFAPGSLYAMGTLSNRNA
jgi:predicted ATPase